MWRQTANIFNLRGWILYLSKTVMMEDVYSKTRKANLTKNVKLIDR